MMRDALTGVVPQPRTWVVERGADVGAIIAEYGAPCVIKPVSRSGSQGVILINDPSTATALLPYTSRLSLALLHNCYRKRWVIGSRGSMYPISYCTYVLRDTQRRYLRLWIADRDREVDFLCPTE